MFDINYILFTITVFFMVLGIIGSELFFGMDSFIATLWIAGIYIFYLFYCENFLDED